MVRAVVEPGTVTRGMSRPWASPDGVVLAVLSGAAKGTMVSVPAELGKELVIGKSRTADLVLPDDAVSRRHFSVTRTSRGIVVRDLDSRNGVRVGGVLVKEGIVEPGTIVAVGETEILVRVELRGAVVPPSERQQFGHVIGQSLAMRRIFGMLERMAATDATIILMGETGTGKDVLAQSIHEASARVSGPFEVLDCGAIAPNLVESELFGHEKGAFTGAERAHAGAFERATGGTLFLDELGELPLSLQPKLLRALESRAVRRVGGSKPIAVDVRVIAATTRDLIEEVEQRRFREDLYFRLAVVPIHVPPLRSRAEDIPAIAASLLLRFGERPLTLAPSAVAQLRSHDWPGNVRELRNVLERAVHLAHASGEQEIAAVDLGAPRNAEQRDVHHFEEGVTYREARARAEAYFEARFLEWLLPRHGGNIAAAARAAQMDRKYLGDLVRKHRILP